MNKVVIQRTNIEEDIDLPAIVIKIEDSIVDIHLVFRKSLNSSFWGTVLIDIFTNNGQQLDITPLVKTVCYNCCSKSYAYDRNKFEDGVYRIDVTVVNEKEKSGKILRKRIGYNTQTFELTL